MACGVGKVIAESAIALAVSTQLAQGCKSGTPGCTIFGCASVFHGVLGTLSCFEECFRSFPVVRSPLSVLSEVLLRLRELGLRGLPGPSARGPAAARAQAVEPAEHLPGGAPGYVHRLRCLKRPQHTGLCPN